MTPGAWLHLAADAALLALVVIRSVTIARLEHALSRHVANAAAARRELHEARLRLEDLEDAPRGLVVPRSFPRTVTLHHEDLEGLDDAEASS